MTWTRLKEMKTMMVADRPEEVEVAMKEARALIGGAWRLALAAGM